MHNCKFRVLIKFYIEGCPYNSELIQSVIIWSNVRKYINILFTILCIRLHVCESMIEKIKGFLENGPGVKFIKEVRFCLSELEKTMNLAYNII